MSIQKDSNGRRWIQAETEVPGTPEEVWEAIATARGVSSWFVPTEEREDGTVVCHFGPGDGMDAVSTRTAWEPPHRFVGEGEGFGPGAPPMATEWIVEARSGGKCVVRVVHSLFASTDDWDNQLGSLESGWPTFFRILRLYLTHFRGQYGQTIQLIGMVPEPAGQTWDSLIHSLGFDGAKAGEKRVSIPGVPRLGGVVERIGEGAHHELLLRLEEPVSGIAHLFAHPMGGQVLLMMRLYFYGDHAAAITERDEPLWQAWINNHTAPANVTC